VALEAEARAKKTEAALARLERLAGAWAKQVGGSLFVQTAGQLREAGDPAGAIQLLDAGAKRFPEDADVQKAIAQARSAGTAAELEQLRTLGYIE
jgi:predicted Zn-dependent protease